MALIVTIYLVTGKKVIARKFISQSLRITSGGRGISELYRYLIGPTALPGAIASQAARLMAFA